MAGGGREAERMQLVVGEAAEPSASDAREGDSGGLGESRSGGRARQWGGLCRQISMGGRGGKSRPGLASGPGPADAGSRGNSPGFLCWSPRRGGRRSCSGKKDDGGVSAVFKASVEHSRHRTAPGWRRGLRPERAGGGGGHGEPLRCAGCGARRELRSGSDLTSLLCWTGPKVSP